MKQKFLKTMLLLCALIAGVNYAWAEEKTITLTYSSFGLTTSYSKKTATVDGIGFTVDQGYKGSGNTIQMNSTKGSGSLYNTTAITGLKSITVNVSSGNKTYTVTTGTTQNPTANSQTGTTGGTYNATTGDTYFQLKVSGASYFSSIVITYDDEPTASLASIALSGDYPISFYQGDAFSHEGMIVTATYEDESTKDVTASAEFTGYNMAATGSQEVTVSYTEGEITKTATYDITVNERPKYTVTFSDGGSVTQASAGASVTLPSRPTIGSYIFAGWSETNVVEETTDAPTIIPAGSYTPTKDITLYPVYSKTEGGGGSVNKTASVTISDYATANSWISGTQYEDIAIDENVTATANGSSNTGKYYTSGGGSWRIYKSEDGYLTISISNGELTSATITFSNSTLSYNSEIITSGTAVSLSGDNASFWAGGTTYITAISVDYTISGSGTTYYWSSPVAAAVARPTIEVAANPFLFSTTATITCETEDAAIKYSFDGEKWSDYTEALTITATTTISAKAVKDNDESQVATVTATKNLAVPTVTIDATGITNTNVFDGTEAGSLAASVTYNETAVEGGTVTWSGDNDEVATIDPATGAVTLVAAGSVTFTATYAGNSDYAEKTATYELTVTNIDPNAPGTENNPYTVAEAIEYINTLGSNTSPSDVYVKGIISQIDSYSSGAITYWISDDGTKTNQMEIYKGKGLNGASFSAKADLELESNVVVCGKVKKYNTIPEFDSGSSIVTMTYVTPTFTVSPTSLTLGYKESKDFTLTTNTDGEITVESSAPAVTTVALKEGTTYTVTYVADGSATITVSSARTEDYKAAMATVTVTAADARVAAPISFAKAEDEVLLSAGTYKQALTNENDLTVAYTSSNPDVATVASDGTVTLKAAGKTTITATYTESDDYLSNTASYELTVFTKANPNLSYETEEIGKTTVDAAFTNELTNPHELTISYSSSDTDVATVDSSTGEVTIVGVGETTITAAFAGNEDYDAGNATYTLTVELATPTLAFEKAEYTGREGESFTAPTLNNPASLTVTYSSSDEEVATVDENTGAITIVAAGTTVITAAFAGNSTYAAGDASYTLKVKEPVRTYARVTESSDLRAGGKYLLVDAGNRTAAFGGIKSNLGTVIAVAENENDVIEIDNHEVAIITLLDAGEGKWYMKFGDEYISYSGSSNGLYSVYSEQPSAKWTLGVSENATTITNASVTGRKLQYNYNNGNSRFACYTSTLTAVQLYFMELPAPELAIDVTDIELGYKGTKAVTVTTNSTGTVSAKSSNEEIATVEKDEETGKWVVSAVPGAEGDATITFTVAATETMGRKTVEATVTVTDDRKTPVMAFSEDAVNVKLSESGSFVAPTLSITYNEEAVDLTVAYASDNEDAVTVNASTGALTFNNELDEAATATITATFAGNDGYKPAAASYTLNITILDYSGIEYAEEGKTYNVNSTDDFDAPALTNPHNLTITYASSDEDVASVDENTGEVTINGAGTATITATFAGDETYEAATATYILNVSKVDAGISFDVASVTIFEGEVFTAPVFQNPNGVTGVTFTSSNTAVVTVTSEGVIALAENAIGTATITATVADNAKFNNAEATTIITVTIPGVVFYESFDKCDGAGGWSGSAGSGTLNETKTDNSGWSFEKGGAANKSAKFGTGSAKGSATTPALGLNGKAKVIFQAGAWNGDSKILNLSIVGNGTISPTSVTLKNNEFTSFEATITGGDVDTKVKFESASTSNNRFFLDEIYVIEEELDVTVGAAGYTTYVAKHAVSIPDGMTGYIATEAGENTITLISVASVPAGTAVVLKAAAGEYNLPVIATASDDVADNLLLASDGTVVGDLNTIFALGKKNGVVGFYLVGNGVTVPAGKAYLEIPAAGVKGFTFVFEDDPDGISNIEHSALDIENSVYDLQGRKIANGQLPKGIYIVNGKKILK